MACRPCEGNCDTSSAQEYAGVYRLGISALPIIALLLPALLAKAIPSHTRHPIVAIPAPVTATWLPVPGVRNATTPPASWLLQQWRPINAHQPRGLCSPHGVQLYFTRSYPTHPIIINPSSDIPRLPTHALNQLAHFGSAFRLCPRRCPVGCCRLDELPCCF